MAVDISAFCQSLSLSDDDDDDDLEVCDLGEIARSSGEKKVANSLIGRVLSTKGVNREGFISTVNFIWRTKKPLKVETIGDNTFVFHFDSQEDKKRVMASGPWKYQENLIVLEIPIGIGNAADMKFEFTSFWVQIHNLLLMCLTKEVGLSLGAQIGQVEEVDLGATGDCLGKYIRVRVKVNVKKPFKRGLKVKLDEKGSVIVALLRYEKLPDLCFKCGIIGNPILECSMKDGVEAQYKYNESIRAAPAQWIQNRGKRMRSSDKMVYIDFSVPPVVKMKDYTVARTNSSGEQSKLLPKEKVVGFSVKERGEISREKSGKSQLSLTDKVGEEDTGNLSPNLVGVGKNFAVTDLIDINID